MMDSCGRAQYPAARGDCRAGSSGGKTGAHRAAGGLGSLPRASRRMASPGAGRLLLDDRLGQRSGPISVRDLGSYPFVHRSSCERDAVGRAQLKAAGVTLRVTVRAEREELAFRLIRNGTGMPLAPRSLVPDDLVAVPVSGLGVARTIGLEWRAGLDPMLPGLLADAMEEVVSLMPVSAEMGRQSKRAG